MNDNTSATSALQLSKEEIDHIENKFLLSRTTTSGRQLAAPNGPRKKASRSELEAVESKGGDEDGQSLASTTSQVNSDDDAVSIASRIHQIVEEQKSNLDNWAAPRRNSCMVQRRPSEPVLESSISRVKSAVHISRLEYEEEPQEAQEPAWLEPLELPEIQIDPLEARRNSTLQESSINQVKWDETDTDNQTEVACRADEEEQPSLRRNNFSLFLPERGNLRKLEDVRREQQQQQTRNRSNTAGHVDRDRLIGDLLNGPIVNIKRSAWKLSDFDHAFKKSESMEQLATNDGSSIGLQSAPSPTASRMSEVLANCGQMSAVVASPQSCSPLSKRRFSQLSLTDRAGTNKLLLMRANKNNFALKGSQVGCHDQLDKNDHSLERGHERRLSHAHSIVSLASSLGSYMAHGQRPRVDARNDRMPEPDEERDQPCIKSCLSMDTVQSCLPIIGSFKGYSLQSFWADFAAGLAVAVINISTCLSAAVVAQTRLSVAFRTSIVNTLVYALLCSSRHASFGSWSIMSQMLLVSVQRALSDELVLARLNKGPEARWQPEEYDRWHLNIIIMYTFLIGLLQLVCGLLKLGNLLASFIPEALCSSMIAATAFTMSVGQLANMCGTSNKILWQIERNTTELWADLKNPAIDITDLFAGLFRWAQQIILLIKYSDQINSVCVIISALSVLLLLFNQLVIQRQLEIFFKRKVFVPFEMILLVIMIIVSHVFNLEQEFQVATCGPISIDLEMPNLPNLRLIRELWFQSTATALISFTMVYIMARTYSNKLNYEIDCNQELIACGAGNLVGGLFDALPATASFSRTAAQVESGGRTQMASLVNCLALALMAQLLGQYVAALPICVMAATLFYGFVRMMARFSEVFLYWRVCKVDFAIWIVTFASIITLDMVQGFIFGFIFSILTMLYRAQSRRCYMLGSIGTTDVYVPLVKYSLAQELEGIKIFQFCGPIHYVCADLFERLLRQKTRVNVKDIAQQLATNKQALNQSKLNSIHRDMDLPTHIILDFSMISYIDSAGLRVIKKIIEDYQRVNITIFLASLASHVAKVVKREPSLWNVHKERFYVTLSDAVHCAVRDSHLNRQQKALFEL